MSVAASPRVGIGLRPSNEPASAAGALARRADNQFALGCLGLGSGVFFPIGLPLLVISIRNLRRAAREGAQLRPAAITLIAGLMLTDCAANFMLLGVFANWPVNGTALGQTVMLDYGRTWDGGYVLAWGSRDLGGPPWPGEQAFLWFCAVLFPMKIVAAWGLLKMKRWGLQWSTVLTWVYIFCWTGYLVQMMIDADVRLAMSQLGATGYFMIGALPWLAPCFMLPYFHSVNKEYWKP